MPVEPGFHASYHFPNVHDKALTDLNTCAPILLLTRPLPQSQRFQQQVLESIHHPLNIQIAPLLNIVPAPGAYDLSHFHAIIATSSNAFTTMTPAQIPLHMPAYCVGDYTAQIARQMGFNAYSSDGNVEGLVRLIRASPPKGPLLYLRGRHVRVDLPPRLQAAGLQVAQQITYDQIEHPLPQDISTQITGPGPVIAPLFSPRTAEIFVRRVQASQNIHILCMSKAVADKINPVFSNRIAHRPTSQAMLQELGAMLDEGKHKDE